MAGPTTRSRENTRARLLDAAAQVFAEVGLEGATVEAVCERAGFTRGAFYSNFESKDELFLTLVGAVYDARLNTVRERVASLVDAGSLVDCDLADLAQQIMETGADERLDLLMMSEIRLRALRDPAFGAAYLAQEKELLSSITAIIEEIAAAGQLELRIAASEAAQLLMTVWESQAARAAMASDDPQRLRRTSSEALARIVELIRA